MKKILTLSMCSVFTAVGAFAASPMGKHDNHTPIEVTSDTLEVQQEKNLAVFTGHVVAIQGDVRLKSDKMTIYYHHPVGKDAKDKKEPVAAEKTATDQKNSIQKIDAEGSVFLSTPEETASGDGGTYDVEHQAIHLHNNVVLTRGPNVLKGDDLVYNFDTGQSILTGGAQTVPGAKGQPRVRALFVPEQKDKK